MEIDKKSQELLDACKSLHEQLDRIEKEKEQKRKEEMEELRRRNSRIRYLKDLFYGGTKGMTLIVPPKSKLPK